jgi:molybdopterin-guanine dinucleotide biosynthesis protein MobB
MSTSPIVAFVAPSGTGKTTYLETLIPALVERGCRVAAVKHDAHAFQVDRPGKDTDRLRRSGAARVAICNDRELAVYGETDEDLTLRALAERYLGEADLVIAEGFRGADVHHVLLCRHGAPHPPYDAGEHQVIAVVGDLAIDDDLPQFPLDDPSPMADFLIGWVASQPTG